MELTTAELAELLHGRSDTEPVRARTRGPASGPVIIRTVTHYYIGNLIDEDDRWLHVEDCSWVADTGRWSTALSTGTLNEVEPYPDGTVVRVAVGAVVDLAPWKHDLPRSVK